MSDCTEKYDLASDTDCSSGITFEDVLGARKSGKKFTEKTFDLAQASCQTGMVCGIPRYGETPAPIDKAIRGQAIKRDNEIHGVTDAAQPSGFGTREEQKREQNAADARTRADQTRARTQKELEQPDPMSVLSAAIDGFESAAGAEAIVRASFASVHRAPFQNRLIGGLEHNFRRVDATIADERKALARATKGTPEYARLEERIRTYDKLKLGRGKSARAEMIADAEMERLNPGGTAFTDEEVIKFLDLRRQEKLLASEKADTWDILIGDRRGAAFRIARGVAGTVGTYLADRQIDSRFVTPGSRAHDFWLPSDAEMAVVGASSTLPVPKFVPGAGGNFWQRLGARALEEGVLWAGTKFGVLIQREGNDPAVERRQLDAAKQAQANDHEEKTPKSMMAAIDAWKALGNHQIQIRQVLNDTMLQLTTTDPARLAETRRDLVALYTANGETILTNGTTIGTLGADGKPLNGPNGLPIPGVKVHNVFGGTDFDFGGVALQNLNAAKNVLMSELGIPSSDEVANRIYAHKRSGIARILDPHEDLPAIFDQLKTMTATNDPDAKWLSAWLATKAVEAKKTLDDEERASIAARDRAHVFVPTFNNYILAKVYQDQALLEIAYAAAGQDGQRHLANAHDLLKAVAGEEGVKVPLGWDGRRVVRNGQPEKRQSDLPQIIEIYKNAGGVVDWQMPS